MTLDEILKGLFPSGHDVKTSAAGLITGTGKRKNGESIAVIGVANGVALGTAGVLPLADEVLNVVAQGGNTPILVLVDTQGQLMARRDEMRGLNEYLAHLAKCLLLASHEGHRTLGLEYGKAAAGAFLATALATDRLVGLPGAQPTVMDSRSRRPSSRRASINCCRWALLRKPGIRTSHWMISSRRRCGIRRR
jgi:malonate decarboxylase gamma subunit